jgi:hypothetical protein
VPAAMASVPCALLDHELTSSCDSGHRITAWCSCFFLARGVRLPPPFIRWAASRNEKQKHKPESQVRLNLQTQDYHSALRCTCKHLARVACQALRAFCTYSNIHAQASGFFPSAATRFDIFFVAMTCLHVFHRRHSSGPSRGTPRC